MAGCSLPGGRSAEGSHEGGGPGGSVSSASVPAGSVSPGTVSSGQPSTQATSTDPSSAPTTSQTTAGDPTADELAQARTAVSAMSLRDEAGQVIVASYPGTDAPVDLVRNLHLAGVILMGDNVASPAQVATSNSTLTREFHRPWGLFIAVDQEGGTVNRIGAPLTAFPTFMTYGATRRPQLAAAAALASGEELRALGFTVVLGPDADVTSGADDPTIGSRSAGSHPRSVASVVEAAVRGYQAAGIVPVIKHFPGHGSVPEDSHDTLAIQTESLATLGRRDLVPFRDAVRRHTPAVMVGHIALQALDPGVPASLSRPDITGLLRQRLGFHGLVVTDALEMAAITNSYSPRRAAVAALRAGADVLLMPPDPAAAVRGIVHAVRNGSLPRRRLDDAATHLVSTLLHQRAGSAAPRRSVIGSHASTSLAASRAAITIVAGPCSGDLVGGGVTPEGDPTVVGMFKAAAERAGLRIGSGPRVALLGYGALPARADIVVSLDTPYVLALSKAAIAKIALYGSTPEAMTALVDVLIGRAHAPGRLPVSVPGAARTGC
jgi:beta-N-acetylhexosaminidase